MAKILIPVSLIFLAVALYFGIVNYRFTSKAAKTEARVKSIYQGHRSITPTFEYTVKGKVYEFEGSSTNADAYQIGDKEIVYYDPASPEDSKLGTFMNLWFIPVFCGGFFVILMLVGVISLIGKRTKSSFFVGEPG